MLHSYLAALIVLLYNFKYNYKKYCCFLNRYELLFKENEEILM